MKRDIEVNHNLVAVGGLFWGAWLVGSVIGLVRVSMGQPVPPVAIGVAFGICILVGVQGLSIMLNKSQ